MGKNRVNPLLKLSRCGSWCFSSLPERLPLNNFHEFQGAISVLAHFSRAEDMIPECLQAQVQEKLNLSDDVEAFYFFLSWSHPITTHPYPPGCRCTWNLCAAALTETGAGEQGTARPVVFFQGLKDRYLNWGSWGVGHDFALKGHLVELCFFFKGYFLRLLDPP